MIKIFESYLEIKDLVFLTWHGNFPQDVEINDVYLQQDHNNLYKNFPHNSQQNYSRPMTEEEKEKYIYNDKKLINYFDSESDWIQLKYSRLIEIIEKNNLTEEEKELKRLKNIEKYKEIDPYGEEDWLDESYDYDNSGKYTKLIHIIDDKIDRSDIDPYGEECWDDNIKIDWEKIKIHHPTKKSIGKKVLIQPMSKYYIEGDWGNPIDTIGIIDEIYNDARHSIGVRWDNGYHNSYNCEDLTIIEI